MKSDKKESDEEILAKLQLLIKLLQKLIIKERTSDGIIRSLVKGELPFTPPHEQFVIPPKNTMYEKILKGYGLYRMKIIEYAARLGPLVSVCEYINPKSLEDNINIIGKSYYRRHGKQLLKDIAQTEILIERFNNKTQANYSPNPSKEIEKLLKTIFSGLAPMKIQIDAEEKDFTYKAQIKLLHDINLEVQERIITNTAKDDIKYRYMFGDTIKVEVSGNNRSPQEYTLTIKPKHLTPEFHLLIISPDKNTAEIV